MPVMDGYAATKAIRAAEGTGRHTPIIALTAGAMVGEEQRCLAAGMDDFLTKPINRELLLATLDRWIGPRAQPPRKRSGHDIRRTQTIGKNRPRRIGSSTPA